MVPLVESGSQRMNSVKRKWKQKPTKRTAAKNFKSCLPVLPFLSPCAPGNASQSTISSLAINASPSQSSIQNQRRRRRRKTKVKTMIYTNGNGKAKACHGLILGKLVSLYWILKICGFGCFSLFKLASLFCLLVWWSDMWFSSFYLREKQKSFNDKLEFFNNNNNNNSDVMNDKIWIIFVFCVCVCFFFF